MDTKLIKKRCFFKLKETYYTSFKGNFDLFQSKAVFKNKIRIFKILQIVYEGIMYISSVTVDTIHLRMSIFPCVSIIYDNICHFYNKNGLLGYDKETYYI